jgi:hypothetical protein
MNNYKFTSTWFDDVAEKTWKELFNLYPKKPKKLLEIGCYEGRATIWLCDNILENGAEYDIVDTFGGTLEESGMNIDDHLSKNSSYIEDNFKHNISFHPNIKFNIYIKDILKKYYLHFLKLKYMILFILMLLIELMIHL